MASLPFVLFAIFVFSSGSCTLNENNDVINEFIDVPEPVVFLGVDSNNEDANDKKDSETPLLLKLLRNPKSEDVVANGLSREDKEDAEDVILRRVIRQATYGYPNSQNSYYSNNPYSTQTPLYPSIDTLKYPYGNQLPSAPTYQPTNNQYPYNTPNNNYHNPAQGPYNTYNRTGNFGTSANYGHASHNTYPKPTNFSNYNPSFNPTNRPPNNTYRPHQNYPTPNSHTPWSRPNSTNFNYQSTTPRYPTQGPYNSYNRPTNPAWNSTNNGHHNIAYNSSGYQPAGYQPGGYQPGVYMPAGHQPAGYQPGGYQPTGYQPGGYQPSNGQNVPFNPNQQQWNSNNAYPIQNGSNTFRLTNSYNPSVPNQPPYNYNLGQSNLYSAASRNATWQNPTKY